MDKAHTEAAHEKAPFPPFQKEHFASQLVWLVLSFVVLYVLLWKFVLPRVALILAARRARIESDLAEAAKAKAESEAALAHYEKSLADARANAQAIAAKTHQELAARSEARRKELEAGLAAKLADAEKKIEATKTAAMKNVRGIAIDTVGAIVERLTGAAPAKPAVERAVDQAINSGVCRCISSTRRNSGSASPSLSFSRCCGGSARIVRSSRASMRAAPRCMTSSPKRDD
jgi:F-type H+-transporting ATPase subunit b